MAVGCTAGVVLVLVLGSLLIFGQDRRVIATGLVFFWFSFFFFFFCLTIFI